MKIPFPVTFPDQAEFGLQKGPLPHPDAGIRRADNCTGLTSFDKLKRCDGGNTSPPPE